MSWDLLGKALALVLVVEGLLPFISPNGYKRAAQELAAQPERIVRGVGLTCIVGGLFLLWLLG